MSYSSIKYNIKVSPDCRLHRVESLARVAKVNDHEGTSKNKNKAVSIERNYNYIVLFV